MNTPAVSVVIPAYHSYRTLPGCLEALRRQTFRDFEVILVDSAPDGRSARIAQEQYPEVTAIHHAGRLLPHQARNLGAERATGRILVFTDPDCYASPGWLAGLVAAQEDGHHAAGGAVDCLPGWWNMATHIARYGWWLPGGEPGPRPEIPSANSSFTRELWEKAGPYRGEWFADDSGMSWRVRAAGEPIWFVPAAVITHDHPLSWGQLLMDRWHRGMDFGNLRPRALAWSPLRCLLQIAALPLSPVVMTLRASGYAARAKHLGSWFATLPVQLAAHSLWCQGEAMSLWRFVWQR